MNSSTEAASNISATDATPPAPESSTTANTRQFEAMRLSDSDDQHNTPGPAAKGKAIDFTDSEDDLDDTSNAFDNLNLPAKLKRLMRDTNFANLSDDSDSEDDPIQDNALFRTPAVVKTAAVQEILKATPPAPPKKPTVDFLAEHSSSSSSSEEETPKRRRKPRATIAPRRQKTRTREKTPGSQEESSSDEEEGATPKRSRPPKRQMSKKAEVLMHKENQRIARSAAAQLQPRTKKLVLGGAVDKIKNRQAAESDDDEEEKVLPIVHNPPPQPSRKQQAIMAFLDDDDSDIEIVGGPSRRAYELASPEQTRTPHHQFWRSPPVTRKTITHRDLNKRLQEQMTREIVSFREEHEKKARARGNYIAPEELAKKQLDREKEAKAIDMQVRQHFLKGSSRPKQSEETNVEEEEVQLVYSGDEEEYDDLEAEDERNDGASDKEPLDLALYDTDDAMSQDEPDLTALEGPKTGIEERKRKRNNALLMSDEDEDEDDDEERQKKLKEGVSLSDFLKDAPQNTQAAEPSKKSKSEYLDAEAQESEDEYYGAGGADLSDDEHLDKFEQDGMLVDKSDEYVDEEALRAALNNQMAETDKHMVERLIKDIMSGDLRRRRAAKESGLMLDDFDIYDDNDNDLVALRLAAAARRRKMQEESGDVLELLAKDEKTKAFAKAGQPLPDTTESMGLSDVEDDNEQDKEPAGKVSMIMESDEEIEIPVDDEDEPEDITIAPDHTLEYMITSPMVDEEERVAVLDRVRDDPSASPNMLLRRRNRLKHLLNDGSGVLGSSRESGPRVGLTAAQQVKERKVSHRTTKNVQFNDTSPIPKRQSRLLSMFK